MSFLNSSKVSNSETSLANASSIAGNSFFLIAFIATSNFAGLPFNSSLPYCSGNFTFTSLVSPAFNPTNCYSKLSIKVPEPISNS